MISATGLPINCVICSSVIAPDAPSIFISEDHGYTSGLAHLLCAERVGLPPPPTHAGPSFDCTVCGDPLLVDEGAISVIAGSAHIRCAQTSFSPEAVSPPPAAASAMIGSWVQLPTTGARNHTNQVVLVVGIGSSSNDAPQYLIRRGGRDTSGELSIPITHLLHTVSIPQIPTAPLPRESSQPLPSETIDYSSGIFSASLNFSRSRWVIASFRGGSTPGEQVLARNAALSCLRNTRALISQARNTHQPRSCVRPYSQPASNSTQLMSQTLANLGCTPRLPPSSTATRRRSDTTASCEATHAQLREIALSTPGLNLVAFIDLASYGNEEDSRFRGVSWRLMSGERSLSSGSSAFICDHLAVLGLAGAQLALCQTLSFLDSIEVDHSNVSLLLCVRRARPSRRLSSVHRFPENDELCTLYSCITGLLDLRSVLVFFGPPNDPHDRLAEAAILAASELHRRENRRDNLLASSANLLPGASALRRALGLGDYTSYLADRRPTDAGDMGSNLIQIFRVRTTRGASRESIARAISSLPALATFSLRYLFNGADSGTFTQQVASAGRFLSDLLNLARNEYSYLSLTEGLALPSYEVSVGNFIFALILSLEVPATARADTMLHLRDLVWRFLNQRSAALAPDPSSPLSPLLMVARQGEGDCGMVDSITCTAFSSIIGAPIRIVHPSPVRGEGGVPYIHTTFNPLSLPPSLVGEVHSWRNSVPSLFCSTTRNILVRYHQGFTYLPLFAADQSNWRGNQSLSQVSESEPESRQFVRHRAPNGPWRLLSPVQDPQPRAHGNLTADATSVPHGSPTLVSNQSLGSQATVVDDTSSDLDRTVSQAYQNTLLENDVADMVDGSASDSDHTASQESQNTLVENDVTDI